MLRRLFGIRAWSIRTKFLALLVFVSLLPTFLLAWRVNGALRRQFWEEFQEQSRVRAERIADHIDDKLNHALSSAEMTTAPAFVREWLADPQEHASLLPHMESFLISEQGQLRKTVCQSATLSIIDSKGQVLLTTNERWKDKTLASLGDWRYWHDFGKLKSGGSIISGPLLWDGEPGPFILAASPVRKDDRFIGAGVAQIATSCLRETIQKDIASLAQGSIGVLVDDRLTCIVHSGDKSLELRPLAPLSPTTRRRMIDESRFGERTEELVSQPTDLSEWAANVNSALEESSDEPFFRTRLLANDEWNWGTATRLKNHPWVYMLAVPEKSIYAQLAHIRVTEAAFAAAVLAVAVSAGLIGGRLLTRPVALFTETIARYGRGDLSARVPPIPPTDEFGQLADEFNKMAEQLQRQSIDLKAALSETATWQHVVQATISELDLERRLEVILEETISHTKVEHGCIYIIDDATGEPSLRANKGLSDELRLELQYWKPDEFWLEEVRVQHESLAEENGDILDAAKREGIRSWLGCPLKIGDRVVGVLFMGSKFREVFDEQTVNIVTSLANPMAIAIENARLYDQAQRRLGRLTTLREIDKAIVSHLSLREVVHVVLEHVPKELEAEAAALSIFDESRRSTEIFAMRTPDGKLIEEQAFTLADSLLHWLTERQEPVVIYDLSEDPRVTMHRKVIEANHLASYLGVPLVAQGKTIGVLHLLTTGLHRFTEEQIGFFSTLAGQAAIALENARLYEAALQRARGLLVIAENTLDISRSVDLDQAEHKILEAARRCTKASYCGYFRYDANAQTFTLTSALGYPEEVIERARRQLVFKLGEERGVVGLVGATRQPVYIQDCHEDPRWIKAEPEIRSAYLVPVAYGERLFGVFSMLGHRSYAFQSGILELTSTFAHYAGSALENLRLYNELRESYETMEEAQRMLAQNERLRALGEMSSGIVHDFNNVLTGILGFADMALLQEDLSASLRRDLEYIRVSALDAAKIVAQIREFYRPRSPGEKLGLLNLNDLVQEAVDLTQVRWKSMPQERGVNIEVRTDLSCATPVTGNADELRQVLTNLIFNAVDAMPEGGVISLCTYTEKGDGDGSSGDAESERAVLRVSDTGTGMPEDVRERCLDPFFTTKGNQGSGLGLSMVYGIVRRHNGALRIDSEPGKGTDVTIALPIPRPKVEVQGTGEADKGKEEGVEAEGERRSLRVNEEVGSRTTDIKAAPTGLRVLCIDDEPVVRDWLQDALGAMGHTVELAAGGAEGIEKFRGGEFDVVITDLGMPNVDGRQVAKTVKAESPQTLVVLLTGWGDRFQHGEEPPEEIDAVIAKPVEIESLRDVLREVQGDASN